MTPEHLQQSLHSSKVTCRDELFALQLGVYRKIHKYTTAAKRPIPPDPISLLLTSTPHRTLPNTNQATLGLPRTSGFLPTSVIEDYQPICNHFLTKVSFFSLQCISTSKFHHICSLRSWECIEILFFVLLEKLFFEQS